MTSKKKTYKPTLKMQLAAAKREAAKNSEGWSDASKLLEKTVKERVELEAKLAEARKTPTLTPTQVAVALQMLGRDYGRANLNNVFVDADGRTVVTNGHWLMRSTRLKRSDSGEGETTTLGIHALAGEKLDSDPSPVLSEQEFSLQYFVEFIKALDIATESPKPKKRSRYSVTPPTGVVRLKVYGDLKPMVAVVKLGDTETIEFLLMPRTKGE